MIKYYGWICGCGAESGGVRFGVGSLGHLIVEWVCNKCKAQCRVVKALDEVIADIPDHPAPRLTESDLELLKGMKILT